MNEIDKRRRKRHRKLELVFVNHFKRENREREKMENHLNVHQEATCGIFFSSTHKLDGIKSLTYIKNHVSGFLIFISLATSHPTYTIVLLICAHCLLCTVCTQFHKNEMVDDVFLCAWKQASLHPLRWEAERDDG